MKFANASRRTLTSFNVYEVQKEITFTVETKVA